MAKIYITNLRLRTIIGINDWERDNEQDVIINITIDYDAARAAKSDKLSDTIDYKKVTKEIIKKTESSKFFLLEKLADTILKIVMKNPRINACSVRVDKPQALRFADSVAVELSETR